MMKNLHMRFESNSRIFLCLMCFFMCHVSFACTTINLDEKIRRSSFPAGFTFGIAASAYQVEGAAQEDGRGPSIWDNFVLTPGRVKGNATGDVADDEYHRYKEDIDLMADMNMDAYRFSISWSRIFPEGSGKVNPQGIEYYNNLIDYMILKGIQPYANLNHYDIPQALETAFGGWRSTLAIQAFTKYADFCFAAFGDRVKHWTTFNEPQVVASLGYDDGIFAPGRCSAPFGNCSEGNSTTEPYIVTHVLLLAHATAVNVYRTKYQKMQNGSIGILLNFNWYEPLTNSFEDILAAQRARDFQLGWFLDPLVYGRYPESMRELVKCRLPEFTKEQFHLVKGSYDFVGINHYTTFYVTNAKKENNVTDYNKDWRVDTQQVDSNGVPIGPRAYTKFLYVVPWGMYKTINYVSKQYPGVKIIVSENGMDQPGNLSVEEGTNDSLRTYYLNGYLKNLLAAIRDGANVHGYFVWSLLDNFEWLSGYTSRFGIVYIDYDDNLKRHPKNSSKWLKKILAK